MKVVCAYIMDHINTYYYGTVVQHWYMYLVYSWQIYVDHVLWHCSSTLLSSLLQVNVYRGQMGIRVLAIRAAFMIHAIPLLTLLAGTTWGTCMSIVVVFMILSIHLGKCIDMHTHTHTSRHNFALDTSWAVLQTIR